MSPDRNPAYRRPWRRRLIDALDVVAHWLYMPTALGQRCVRARWHHRIHLIPARLAEKACEASDQALLRDEAYLATLDWQMTIGPPPPTIWINGQPAEYDPKIEAWTVHKILVTGNATSWNTASQPPEESSR